VRAASGALQSGDLLFVSYSGHGGQITDVSGEEDDKLDETWCLYDGEPIDDEVFLELRRIAAGVPVLVLSDSCHSSRGKSSRTYAPAGTCATRSICLGSRRRPDRFLGH
jgi:metacaspase-1